MGLTECVKDNEKDPVGPSHIANPEMLPQMNTQDNEVVFKVQKSTNGVQSASQHTGLKYPDLVFWPLEGMPFVGMDLAVAAYVFSNRLDMSMKYVDSIKKGSMKSRLSTYAQPTISVA
ncbi:hypothetical protein PIB30_053163 [Stylosanthes scabra]|uniref:Uncharacterized protein n=1 Tax=Stylosanthes scabra TaxID=79078 RepID=A0ABU6TKF5_9FABA|nr:hypothetical protein [Stylosanthes scabra]